MILHSACMIVEYSASEMHLITAKRYDVLTDNAAYCSHVHSRSHNMTTTNTRNKFTECAAGSVFCVTVHNLRNSSGVITCLPLIDRFTLYCYHMLMKKFPLIECTARYFAATYKIRHR
jgi:hypothetical protein